MKTFIFTEQNVERRICVFYSTKNQQEIHENMQKKHPSLRRLFTPVFMTVSESGSSRFLEADKWNKKNNIKTIGLVYSPKECVSINIFVWCIHDSNNFVFEYLMFAKYVFLHSAINNSWLFTLPNTLCAIEEKLIT